MDFIIIYIFCFLTSYSIFSYGYALNKVLFKFKNENILECNLIGIIFLSFLALFLNFFTSLNVYLNTFLFIASFIFLFIFRNSINFNDVSKKIIIISLIGFVTFLLDHSNRPDAGLYHLPYTSMLNEDKLIFGSVNLHFRFGHISSLQYLYAIYNNLLFEDNGVLIPLTIFYASILVYLYEEIKFQKEIILKFFLIFLLIFILTTMNRYSGFGNDDPAHMLYLVSIYYVLRFFIEKKDQSQTFYDKIVLYSVSTFLIKQFYILILIFPFIIFILNFKKIKIFSKPNLFSTFFILLWVIKNILVSSCVLYPVNFTCIESLKWSPSNTVSDAKRVSIISEAWAKAYPDRINKSKNVFEHLVDYEWVQGWMSNHVKVVIKKISPISILIFLISIYCYFSLNRKRGNHLQIILLFILLINLIFSAFWFLKFPTYRYGAAYLGSCIIITGILFLNKFNDIKNIKKILSTILILICFIVASKNLSRIYKNYDYRYVDYPWPKKNSFTDSNYKNNNLPKIKNKQIIYYIASPYTLCMYSKSPCTSSKDLNLNRYINNWKYKIFFFDQE